MEVKKVAQEILREVGGESNIQNLTHCVTRLRFNLKSMDGVDESKIKNITGVVDVVNKGGQFQVIIGSEVARVYGELIKLCNFNDNKEDSSDGPKKGLVNKILDTIAGIFSPIMPIIAGAGMIKALLSILTLVNAIDTSGNLYYFLKFIADASYYFLPIILAVSAAKKFQCNQQMAMLMGAILLHPNFSALKDTAGTVFVLGLPVRIVTYSSSVIPIILIVFVLSYVEKFVEKITPPVIKFIARPLLTILIMAPIALVVLGPLGSIIGDGLVSVLLSIEKIAPWILPTVIGAFMPFLVMTGMHYSLLPAYVNSLSVLGHETIIGPGNLPSNIAQGAAALCVAIKTKNKDFRQLSISSGITALLGITEPALFGVNLRLKKPLIATTIGGGLGGLYAGITGVQRYGGGGAGLAAIGLYVGEDSSNVINALISAAIAFAVTFAIQWYIGFEDVKSKTGGGTIPEIKAAEKQGLLTSEEQYTIYSPLKGELVPISEVSDPAFSSEAMGKTIAIKPSEGKIYSPVNGKLMTIFETKHAIGLVAENGAELLIHVGIDTVELKGKYFKTHVTEGDTLKTGDLLLEFDYEEIEKNGYDPITLMIITNSFQYSEIIGENVEKVHAGDKILTLR
ncbi:beta-glucoside-specific PTS transporter subunit IIABC [Lacrimispora sp.]|jgi:PTS system beta-glucosides-specific IIC component|uniref:beta-glucoside-specific PTS transporter subunit IIABC n=1 Tax=Lacrimispora sp. TaxID=2719234 RepID=UPI0028A90983|nr:beta-glucoside-specific PTS transporter subunit IIABC [Lacrimispora sp.]